MINDISSLIQNAQAGLGGMSNISGINSGIGALSGFNAGQEQQAAMQSQALNQQSQEIQNQMDQIKAQQQGSQTPAIAAKAQADTAASLASPQLTNPGLYAQEIKTTQQADISSKIAQMSQDDLKTVDAHQTGALRASELIKAGLDPTTNQGAADAVNNVLSDNNTVGHPAKGQLWTPEQVQILQAHAASALNTRDQVNAQRNMTQSEQAALELERVSGVNRILVAEVQADNTLWRSIATNPNQLSAEFKGLQAAVTLQKYVTPEQKDALLNNFSNQYAVSPEFKMAATMGDKIYTKEVMQDPSIQVQHAQQLIAQYPDMDSAAKASLQQLDGKQDKPTGAQVIESAWLSAQMSRWTTQKYNSQFPPTMRPVLTDDQAEAKGFKPINSGAAPGSFSNSPSTAQSMVLGNTAAPAGSGNKGDVPVLNNIDDFRKLDPSKNPTAMYQMPSGKTYQYTYDQKTHTYVPSTSQGPSALSAVTGKQ